MKKRNNIIKEIELLGVVSQTPISLLDKNGNSLYCPVVEEHHYFPAQAMEEIISLMQKKGLQNNTPYIHLFSLKIMLGLIKLANDSYILVGPVCITQFSIDDTISALSNYLTKEDILHFHTLLESYVPIDFFRFAGVVSQVSNTYNKTSFSPSEIINNNFLNHIKVKPLEASEYTRLNSLSIASVQMFIINLMSIIATGNMDALIKHWQSPTIRTFLSSSTIKDDTYFFITPIYAYMFEGALQGGANLHLCYEKYTFQVSRFKQATNLIECITELQRSSYEYCNLVNESKRRDYMPEILRTCVSYINDHIQEKITVDDLAHLCGIHRNKLYDIFHAHFDITIAEYIEKERLRRAVLLLGASNYTLSEIASTMGYASQSHFTKIFKKHYGCTPGQYIKVKA